jgi:hypothetical protein
MRKKRSIVFIDNKQTYSTEFRIPRYFIFQSILEKEGFDTCVIYGKFHHGLKKYINLDKNHERKNIGIKNISYQNHISIARLFSEIFFGFQVLFKSFKILKKAKIIVLNDSAILYNYLFYFLKPFFNYQILIDSNDLWPEIFFRNETLLKKILVNLKLKLYGLSDFFISVNKSYFDYYKSIIKNVKHKEIIHLGFSKNMYFDLKCNLFDKDSRRLLYLGSLGANYEIEKIVEFAEKNNIGVDFFGTGDKYSYLLAKEKITNGLVSVYEPKGLKDFKLTNKKYLCGLAIYNHNSLVKFPTKVFDYWTFNLPVVCSVGDELKDLFDSKSYLGIYVDNLQNIKYEDLQKRFYKSNDKNKTENIVIDNIVSSFFKKL